MASAEDSDDGNCRHCNFASDEKVCEECHGNCEKCNTHFDSCYLGRALAEDKGMQEARDHVDAMLKNKNFKKKQMKKKAQAKKKKEEAKPAAADPAECPRCEQDYSKGWVRKCSDCQTCYKCMHLDDCSKNFELGANSEFCPRCIEDYEDENGEEQKGAEVAAHCKECGVCEDCEHMDDCSNAE
jgi:hypothetical protein